MAEPARIDQVIPPRGHWSSVIEAGEVLTIVDLEGQQAVDFLVYGADDPLERYHAPNTLKAAGTVMLTTGHVLYSDIARPLMTIVEDSFGGHDTIGGCCSAPSNRMLYGTANTGCRENFLSALSAHGLGRRDIVPNVNWFMRVPVGAAGDAAIALGASKPGDRVRLRADQKVIAVLSNCPQVLNPCNNFNPTAIRVLVGSE
ncbi:MAG: DUF1989 domain-containing protein [Rhizobiales bacterium]|nr:DUF1989 domain-containing protein [Hyphomicrobiales bacterium]